MHRTPLVLLVVIVTGSVLLACGDDDGTGERVADVAALAAQLDGIGSGCTLEYEGLVDDQREVSVCTLDDDIATLSVWTDADALATLVESANAEGNPLVSGPNWTIDVSDRDLASEIATATGGTDHR